MRNHKQHTLAKIQLWNGDEVITNVYFLRFIFGYRIKILIPMIGILSVLSRKNTIVKNFLVITKLYFI